MAGTVLRKRLHDGSRSRSSDVTLAHEGEAAFRDRYELVYRHRAERPNSIWQADHTNDQGTGWIQVHGASESRHPVRGTVRATSGRSTTVGTG